MRKFAAIPFFVLAAKVCPEKCEATLFALLMALSNFGGDVGSYIGVGLLRAFDVSKNDWTNLPKVVLIKSMARFIPIILIPLLIPDASPADEILSEKEKHLDLDTQAGDDEDEIELELEAPNAGGIEMGKRGVSIDSAGSSGGASPTRRRPSVAGRAAATAAAATTDLDVLGGTQLDSSSRVMQ